MFRYLQRRASLREEYATLEPSSLIIIDEIQKAPSLLDEVHWLIENKKLVFALCGSSARKVVKENANLLGGRALRQELHGLTRAEIGDDFKLSKILQYENLPPHYTNETPEDGVDAYVRDYLEEEIHAEAAVNNIPKFINFLRAAALGDGEIINFTNIASDCGVTSATVKNHYQILIDTLIGSFLPAYTNRPKRRLVHSPKFYFHNVGIVNSLVKRRHVEPGSEVYGKAFENWILHEIRAYNSYKKKRWDLSYWRTSTRHEVDIVINDCECAIEIKSAENIHATHLKGPREFKIEYPNTAKRVLVCREATKRTTDDGIDILPYENFLTLLWDGILAN